MRPERATDVALFTQLLRDAARRRARTTDEAGGHVSRLSLDELVRLVAALTRVQ